MLSSIVVFLLVLSILILVHEIGHFISAKRAGVWVEEFGIGLPPRVFGKKFGQTIYSLNLLPFGGFVRMHGEEITTKLKKPRMAFVNKSKKARAWIVSAGVVMNFLLGILAFAIVYSFSGIPRSSGMVKILDVSPYSPAQEAKILAGDIIVSFDGSRVVSNEQFLALLNEKKGEKIKLSIIREEDDSRVSKEFSLVPRVEFPEGDGPLGITITSTEIYYPPIWQRPFLGIYHGTKEALFWGKTISFSLVGMLVGLFKGQVPTDVSGPVGIFAITSEAAKVGVLSLINFIGVLSINLAILNIMPFPALDGGRLLFIFLETILGRRVLPKVEAYLHMAGMVILLLLLFAITAGDIKRLIKAGGISQFIDSFIK